MKEAEFNDLIDCNFPYNDRPEALALIDQANDISPNAMFVVLDELCRPGAGANVSTETLLELIDAWSERMNHPLSGPIVSAARVMVSGSHQSVASAADLMEKVALFEGQYAALSIAYMSCDDEDDLLGVRENEIRAKWEAK